MRIKKWYCPRCGEFRKNYIDAIPKDSDIKQPCCKSCITPLINIYNEVTKITNKATEEHAKKIIAKHEEKERTITSKPMLTTYPGTLLSETYYSHEDKEIYDKLKNMVSDYISRTILPDNLADNNSTNSVQDKPLTMAELDALEINEEENCKESKSIANKASKINSLNFKGLMYTQEQIDALPPGSTYMVKVLHEEGDIYLNYIKTSETNSELLGEYEYF